VEIFGRGRFRIIHHLAMVATGMRWISSMDDVSGSSTIWRWWLRGSMVARGMWWKSSTYDGSRSSMPTSGSHRGHAVEIFGRGRFRIIHHLAMVATGMRWISSMDDVSGSSTIWRWWLRGSMVATGRKEQELLADAEAGEEGIEDVIGADFSGDLTEVIQCMA
jgi:hypothetical protein